MKCDICAKEAEYYSDENVEQYYCRECGWWINV